MNNTKKSTQPPVRKWHEENNHTYESGAFALGVSRATYANLLNEQKPKKIVLLALESLKNNHQK